MKKILWQLMLIAAVTCAVSASAQAADTTFALPGEEQAAQELAALGLLRGDGTGFALEAPCDRLQGAALFTRLLGREEEALAHLRPHPFLDMSANDWATTYVAYLYNKGLAYGVAYNAYGRGVMPPQQFATFCLRALDYTEGNINSDFQWSEALDFMVLQHIISGNLRNRLAAAPQFTRGDAVLLAYAALASEVKEGGQTLLQRLQKEGVVTAEQAAAFAGWPADLRLAYPQGLLDAGLLISLGAKRGLTVAVKPYAPRGFSEEEIYRQLREEERSFDICLLPAYLAERLLEEELLAPLRQSDFGGPENYITALRDIPGYDKERRLYYALPLAFEASLLYYNSARVQNPDWSWLFRTAYSGGVYMPADPARLIPLALHYYKLPYDTAEDSKLLPAVKLLSEQAAAVAAYLDQHMLDIAEEEGAVFGVISSRDLPQLQQRQEENSAYSSWRAVLPPSGGPLSAYYAVIPKNGAAKTAAAFLQELCQPATAAAHAQLGGYLPAIRSAGGYLQGSLAAAYITAQGERCRPLLLDRQTQAFYEQTQLNMLLDQAQNTAQPAVNGLEFTFLRSGKVYQTCRVDLVNKTAAVFRSGEDGGALMQTLALTFREDQAKACAKELARWGLPLWKEYYDGPADGPEWRLRISLAGGGEQICRGYSLPPAWNNIASALLAFSGAEIIPAML